jgi:hypothetical protein
MLKLRIKEIRYPTCSNFIIQQRRFGFWFDYTRDVAIGTEVYKFSSYKKAMEYVRHIAEKELERLSRKSSTKPKIIKHDVDMQGLIETVKESRLNKESQK